MNAPAAQAGDRWRLHVPALLAGLTLAARLPFLFPSVIDWDESTFILIGQSWAEGHLPFTELWDLKGPLLFAPFALTIELFGRSIVAIRLMGALSIFLTGYAAYHLVFRLLGPRGALAGAAFTILTVTVAPGGQVVMSEIIAILPLTLAALAMSEGERRPLAGSAAGVCVSIATLVRPNLGLCALALGVFGLLQARGGGWPERARWALGYILGGALPVLILVLLYARTGDLELLIESLLGPSLAYATSNLSAGEVGGTLLKGVIGRLIEPRFIVYLLAALPLFVAVAWLARCWQQLDDRQRELVLLITAMALTVMASILIGGQAWLHYLIQLLPFTCPLIGILVAPTLSPLAGRPRLAGLATIAVLFAASAPVAHGYAELAGKLRAHGTPFTDPGYRTATYLGRRLEPDDRVLFLTHHIAGWLLGRQPIDRIAHPSNLARDEHVPVPGRLVSILTTRPRFVVFSEKRRVLALEPRIRAVLDPILERDYREVARFDDVMIFERRTGRGDDQRP